MLSLSNYELLELPPVFQRLPRPQWREEESQEYFNWLMSIKDGRVRLLESACGVSEDEPRETRLSRIGSEVFLFLDALGPKSKNAPGRDWSGMGFLFGIDIALLIAKELIAGVPGAAWTIYNSKDRLEFENKLTVVKTSRGVIVYEPLFQGRPALNLVDRDVLYMGAGALQRCYSRWSESLQLRKFRKADV